MTIYYIDPSAPVNGNGLTESTPYNTVGFIGGANSYLFKRGTTFNGVVSLGNGTSTSLRLIIGSYGDESLPYPVINATGAISAFGSDYVTIEEIQVSGTGNGINIDSGTFVDINNVIFNSVGLFANKAFNINVRNCIFNNSTVAIQGSARDSVNMDNWNIVGNKFISCGTGIYFRTSENSTFTEGRMANLLVKNNKFLNTTGTAIQLNCAAHVTGINMGVTAPSTITRTGNWPAYPVGSKIWLTNFTNTSNFGEFTVASVSGSNLVVSETSLTTEASSSGKTVWLFREDRAFLDTIIEDNYILNCGLTAILTDTMLRGRIQRNTIDGARGAGAIENGNNKNIFIEWNLIKNLTTDSIDGMGIFLDNAVRDCFVRMNYIENCAGSGLDNSGACIALFNCVNNIFSGNICVGSKRGVWTGASGTSSNIVCNNVFANNDVGIRINSSPPNQGNTFQNNIVLNNDVGISDNRNQKIKSNLWFGNTTLHNSGFLDSSPVYDDPVLDVNFKPTELSPSSVKVGGSRLTDNIKDISGKYFDNPPSIGAYQYRKPRNAR